MIVLLIHKIDVDKYISAYVDTNCVIIRAVFLIITVTMKAEYTIGCDATL